MTTYTVHAKRWAHGWELHIEGVGVTQSRSLAKARETVRDYIETLTDTDLGPDDRIMLRDDDLGDLNAEIEQVRNLTREAEEMQRRSADRARALAQELRRQGLSGAESAVVLDVSPQRVSQLLNA